MLSSTLLQTIRSQRRFEIEDVAKATGISLRRLIEFEAGDREPSHIQLSKLAKAYGLPSYLLALETLPNLPEPIPDFRKATPAPSELSPSGMRRIWSSENIAHLSKQLLIELRYSPPAWSKEVAGIKASKQGASKLRAYFNEWLFKRRDGFGFLGDEEQVFLGGLRLFFEVQGNVVSINDAPPVDFMGFYLDGDGGIPAIFVNRKILSKKAQLFTFVHEYCHHLMGIEGISNPFRARNDVERKCNQFAAEFLAPMGDFQRLVEDQTPTVYRDPQELVRVVSSQTLLSNYATAVRLVEGGYIRREALGVWRARNKRLLEDEKQSEAPLDSFGQPHAKRVSELGYLSTYLSAEGVSKKIVDGLDVSQGLGLSSSLQTRAFALAKRRIELAFDA